MTTKTKMMICVALTLMSTPAAFAADSPRSGWEREGKIASVRQLPLVLEATVCMLFTVALQPQNR